jgi:glycosyltransferase involved in cell wall biosynthesis
VVRLTALVASADHVCCRYRLAAFRPFLEKAGYELELRPVPDRVHGWWRLGRDLSSADGVILQRKLLSAWKLYLVRRAARFLLYDFDDAVFLRDSYASKGLQSARRQRRFAATVRAADLVVAGNAFLRDHAARWTDSRGVHVVPTCLDPAHYPTADHVRAGDGVELVWVGSSSTLQGLERARPLLEHIGRCRPGLRLRLVSDRLLKFLHLPVVPCPWSAEGEAAALAAADVGVSWVPDDPWSRGKCGLKVLQYLAAGLPVVANPVGVQAELVRPGETGFLAETPDQWAEAVVRLASDPELRRRMGRAGRRLVEDKFSLAAGAAKWLALLAGLGEGRKTA